MRLVRKLTFALIVGISAVLVVNGWLRVRREVALFESDRVRDHKLVGLALSAAIAAVWRVDGEARAQATIAQASAREHKVRIRWIGMDAVAAGDARSAAALAGEPVTRIVTDSSGEAVRRTFVPVTVDGSVLGALELSESLASERDYVRRTVVDTVLTTALLALVMTAILLGLGAWLVGRPMHILTSKARRIGMGDFSGPLRLRQRDEIAELASEMNLMCDRLVEANERTAAETARRIAALEQLRHADRLMTVGKLASGVAHELGTPLNVIEARAGMIADGEATLPETVSYAQIIVTSCAQMTRIIRQLLEFARPRGPERAPQDMRRVVERSVTLLKQIASKRGVTLTVLDAPEPAMADVDASQIQQVITNLLMNAIQATDGSGTVEISVSRVRSVAARDRGVGDAEAENICVRVRDDGRGIAPEHLPHIFEPFFTTKDVGQGTGLGLSVAYGIVREHQGWMDVHSAPGEGTEFLVYLPGWRQA
jgi:signal transduction histidine kinase